MKIIQTNKAYYPKVGGIETTITILSEGLVKKFNADVSVLVCNEKTTLKTKHKKINNVNVHYLATYGFIASLPISPSYFYSLSKLNGDILHIHEPFPLADLSIALISKIKKNFSHIVISWHSDIIRQKWVLSFYRKYIYNLLELTDKIIVSNPKLIDNSEFLPSYRNKCQVIPIGVNLDWTNKPFGEKKFNFNHRSNSISLLFVGRLVYYKGIEYLLEAMKLIPDATLTIIGSGKLKNKIIAQINELKLNGRAVVIPEIDEETLHSYYKSCDILILPSIEKSETYGIVQIEAMACGKPIICTELGTGTTFINQNNITGLVVPPRDSKALSDAINKLSNDKILRLELGSHAKIRALEEFKSDTMVERVYQLYRDLLKK